MIVERCNRYGRDGTRSTIEGGRGCNNFVPVLRGNGTKIFSTGDIFDQPPGGMSWVRGKLADHVGDHVVLSPEERVFVTSPGTESSYPRLRQSLNNSWLVYSLLIMQIWVTRRQEVAQIGRSSVEWFATFWGIHGEFGTT